jgi:hypothetical protein
MCYGQDIQIIVNPDGTHSTVINNGKFLLLFSPMVLTQQLLRMEIQPLRSTWMELIPQ